MDDDEEGVAADVGDRREIGDRIVGRLLLHRRHRRHRTVGGHQQRVAVGGRLGHFGRGDGAVGAALFSTTQRLPERLRDRIGEDARRVGGRAAGRGR